MYNNDDVIDTRVYTLQSNVERFQRYGTILPKVIKNCEGELGKIGQLSNGIVIVFYPDGTIDRFEDGNVMYRDGWVVETNAAKPATIKKTKAVAKTIKTKTAAKSAAKTVKTAAKTIKTKAVTKTAAKVNFTAEIKALEKVIINESKNEKISTDLPKRKNTAWKTMVDMVKETSALSKMKTSVAKKKVLS